MSAFRVTLGPASLYKIREIVAQHGPLGSDVCVGGVTTTGPSTRSAARCRTTDHAPVKDDHPAPERGGEAPCGSRRVLGGRGLVTRFAEHFRNGTDVWRDFDPARLKGIVK